MWSGIEKSTGTKRLILPYLTIDNQIISFPSQISDVLVGLCTAVSSDANNDPVYLGHKRKIQVNQLDSSNKHSISYNGNQSPN